MFPPPLATLPLASHSGDALHAVLATQGALVRTLQGVPRAEHFHHVGQYVALHAERLLHVQHGLQAGPLACIILGIAVDDTIHSLVRYCDQVRLYGDESKSVLEALRIVARPATTTTAALCGGFSVLMFSDLRHQAEFGLLTTLLLAFAWLVDMSFLAALAAKMRLGRNSEEVAS